MTSRLVEFEEDEASSGRSWKPLLFSLLKLFLGIAAVGAFYVLEQRLNAMGCRFAVNSAVSVVGGAGLLVVGREILNHKYTGYALDIGYLLVVGFILVSSVQGLNSLENGGCENYFEENTDVRVTNTTQFMNETEYKEWKKSNQGLENTPAKQAEYSSNYN
jgi:selenocysteine lyase/cysteine desulfurase